MAAIRIVTNVWGNPASLDRDRAKKLWKKAEDNFRETRKKGDKLSSPAMDMLGHFMRDYGSELCGARDLTYEYLAERTLMSERSVRRCLKALEDEGLISVVRSRTADS